MVKSIPSYLKLVTAASEPLERDKEDLASLLACCRAFEGSTGWPLEFVPGKPANQELPLVWSAPVDPGVGASPGHIRLISGDADPAGASSRTALPDAKALAAALAGMWVGTRKALWQREAELAAGVPVAARADEKQHLAARLEAVLAAGAEALDCQAAAVYLLDAGTSELKLRASWGLPRGRLIVPARPLRGAAADLEALLGQAVVLSDRQMFDYWRVPEPCAAAVCLPVSSPTTPLGTLWMFANESRDFTPAQTNVLEIVSGRVAAELEREMLLREVDSLHGARPHVAAVERRWQSGSPPSPCVEGWDIAAATASGGHIGGGWCDWFTIASDRLAVTLGSCSTDMGGALAGTAARAAVRTAADVQQGPAQLLARLNDALWAGDQGDASLGLVYSVLDTHHGVLRAAQCGSVGLVAKIGGKTRTMANLVRNLGADDQLALKDHQFKLASGDTAVLWGGPMAVGAGAAAGTCVATLLEQFSQLPAGQLAALIRDGLGEQVPGDTPWTALVLRHQNQPRA